MLGEEATKSGDESGREQKATGSPLKGGRAKMLEDGDGDGEPR